MIKNYSVRTDLALEEKERFESDHVEISGVVLEEDYDEASELRVTRVEIKTENGAKAMGKPVGTYLTIETPNLAMPDEKSQTVIAEKVCSFIKELIRKFEVKDKDLSILVVGLGNREVTPDSLGPCVADHLSVTRHIVKEYGKYAIGVDDAPMISAVVPGVMGVAAFAPPLDDAGNSAKAQKALGYIVTRLNLNIFSPRRCVMEGHEMEAKADQAREGRPNEQEPVQA